MSVVAARVYNDRIEVAADTICIRGGDKLKDAEKSHTKLFRHKDLVVGGVGISSEIGLIQRYMKSHIIKEMTEDCIFDFFVEFSKWKNDLTSDKDIENSYLLASQGKCFYVNKHFVCRITDFHAIGAGDDYAKGAMYMGASPREAVKAACDLCIYVSEPILLETIPITSNFS